MFSQQQETIIVNMVLQNNLIRLREIQQRVEEDNVNFEGINSVSLSTIDHVLKRNLISLKQAYRVPFERNSERVKELRYQYVQVSNHVQRLYSTIELLYIFTVLNVMQHMYTEAWSLECYVIYVFYRECFNWIPWRGLMSASSWMKLASI